MYAYADILIYASYIEYDSWNQISFACSSPTEEKTLLSETGHPPDRATGGSITFKHHSAGHFCSREIILLLASAIV